MQLTVLLLCTSGFVLVLCITTHNVTKHTCITYGSMFNKHVALLYFVSISSKDNIKGYVRYEKLSDRFYGNKILEDAR